MACVPCSQSDQWNPRIGLEAKSLHNHILFRCSFRGHLPLADGCCDWVGKLRLLPLHICATTQGVRAQGTIETTQAVRLPHWPSPSPLLHCRIKSPQLEGQPSPPLP